MDVDKEIRKLFRVKKRFRDTVPYHGWLESSREHISELMAKVGYTYGAEIGVNAGRHALEMYKTIPNLKLICVDPWKAFSHSTDDHMERQYQSCKKRLGPYNVEYMRMPSMEAVGQIEDESLDFVYIDAMHNFDNVMMDIICWSKKVRKGGIVSGHDYFHAYAIGVINAVNAYTISHSIHEWYITREKLTPPSFFWVKR